MSAFLVHQHRLVWQASADKVRLQVIELGAGSGVCGLVAESLLSRSGIQKCRVVFTDVPEVVQTSLTDNLDEHRPSQGVERRSVPLTWGASNAKDCEAILDDTCDVMVLASDVLYNTSSHADLLWTIKHLATHPKVRKFEALFGFKHRTEGDAAFFDVARNEGFDISRVLLWGGVSVWHLK